MRRWKAETVFRNVVASIFLLTGQFIRTEKHTSQGRIDSVVETPEHVYIFEFKVDKPVEVALEQIERNGYAQSYATDPPHPPQNRRRLLHQDPYPLRLARSAGAGGQSPLICRAALDRGNCLPARPYALAEQATRPLRGWAGARGCQRSGRGGTFGRGAAQPRVSERGREWLRDLVAPGPECRFARFFRRAGWRVLPAGWPGTVLAEIAFRADGENGRILLEKSGASEYDVVPTNEPKIPWP